MKTKIRHLIAALLILILAAALEILVFNGDTIGSGYSYLRYNAVGNDEQSDRETLDSSTNADDSHQATGYHVTSKISDKLTALSADEANEIEVRMDNERILAEYRGETYTPEYDEDIVVGEDGTLMRKVRQMHIVLELGQDYYIKKLRLDADLTKNGGFQADAYHNGEPVQDGMYCSIDPKIDAGIMSVGCHADKLDITLLTEDELTPEDVQIEISAKLQFSFLRAAFFAVCLFTVYILFFAGKDVYAFLKKKPEWFFAIFTLMLGGLIIEGLGSNMVGYDEYVHAKSAYKLSFGSTIETTEAAMQMVGNNLPYFNNPEERELVEAYEDKVNDPDYIAPDIGHQSRLPRTETRVYYPMAAGFYLGRVLHTGFVDMMELARLGNLLCYIFIVFWAVKKAKGYQMVVAAIGMFPNNVFIASSLSYDMLVNAGLLLGYVLLLNEILTPDEKIKPSNAFFMLFSFMAGCLSKPVYIVMSLMLLFLPKKKFQNRVSEIVFKTALLFLNGLMIYNIFFPTPVSGGDYALVSNSAYAGDKRSIGTSTVGQLQFVMSNPLQYAVILLRSMFDMLMDYTVKGNPFVSYGYMGAAGYLTNWLMIALGLFAALFANVKTSIRKGMGALTHLMNFGVVAIVFSSMYISYTAVGSSNILGVQGRYVIPLFLPFLSCFMGWGIIRAQKTKAEGYVVKLRNRLQALPAVYERIIFGVMMAVSLWMTLKLIILTINV